MISSKYLPKITVFLVSVTLILCILAMRYYNELFCIVNSSGYSLEYPTELFNTEKIIDIDILMDEESWNEMLDNATAENYYTCDVVINETTFHNVGIRPKGNTSLSSIARDPDNNRYSFKLEFDQFVDGQTCFGLDKLILNNNFADTTAMKEALVYDMFSYLSADASLYNYAKISVNNEYFGVYLALEAVEDSFMLRNFSTEKGYLYKPDRMNHNKNKGNFNNPPQMPGDWSPPQMWEGRRPPQMENPNLNQMENHNMPTTENTQEQIPNRDFNSRQFNGERPPFAPDGENPEAFAKENLPQGMMPGGPGRAGRRAGMGGGPGSMGGGNLNYSDDKLSSYQTIWDGSINKSSETDHLRIIKALKNINSQTNLEEYLDVDNVLKYMAVHNFSVNEDSLSGNMAHNYYLYESNGRLNIIPWDYNLAFGGMRSTNSSKVINDPIDDSYASTTFFDALLKNEDYKARYHEYYRKLIDEYFYNGRFDDMYQRIRNQIDSLVETDPNAMYTYEEYIKGTDMFYKATKLRAESIKGQLDGTIPSTSEGQLNDSSTLVDASSIDLSIMGSFGHGRDMPGMPAPPDTMNK